RRSELHLTPGVCASPSVASTAERPPATIRDRRAPSPPAPASAVSGAVRPLFFPLALPRGKREKPWLAFPPASTGGAAAPICDAPAGMMPALSTRRGGGRLMPEHKYISIRGAREHNLKNVDLDLPRDRLIVMTGLSGSGKSSLAFDTIYAEGQRRYVESLSAYARQFLEMMQKPDVDQIDGLSPAI